MGLARLAGREAGRYKLPVPEAGGRQNPPVIDP